MRILAALLITTLTAFGATIVSDSASYTDVATAVASASNGDTVTIPAGTATWTTGFELDKAITLQGAGVGQTIIKDGIADGSRFWDVALVANLTTRITGIEFQDDGAGAGYIPRIKVSGSNIDNRRLRVDNCKFSSLSYAAMDLYTVLGVIDNCEFICKAAGQQVWVAFVHGTSWGYAADSANWGDGAWVAADQFGTDQFLYFEDCTFNSLYGTTLTMIDAFAGARYAVRYCEINKGHLDTHGAESSRTRGGRAFEIYMNTFTGDGSLSTPTYYRSGVGVIWSNSIAEFSTSAVLSLLDNRLRDHLFGPAWGADGRNPWDKNNAGNPFETGTATSAGTLTVTDAAQSWTVNEWAGYTVRRTSGKSISSLTRSGTAHTVAATGHGFTTGDLVSIWGADQQQWNGIFTVAVPGPDSFTFDYYFTPTETEATGTLLCAKGTSYAVIASNTGTQLTFADSIYGATRRLVFATSDTFEITKIDQTVDQPGITGGADLAGENVPDVWTNTQTVSPWYEWENYREGGVDVNFSTSFDGGIYYTIQAGTHFKNNTEKPGYTPYTYPHPLRGEGTPAATRRMTVTKLNAGTVRGP